MNISLNQCCNLFQDFKRFDEQLIFNWYEHLRSFDKQISSGPMWVDFLFILRTTSSTWFSFHFWCMWADNPFTIHSSLFNTFLISAIFANFSGRFVYMTCWHLLFPTILNTTAEISKTSTSKNKGMIGEYMHNWFIISICRTCSKSIQTTIIFHDYKSSIFILVVQDWIIVLYYSNSNFN